jgi:hypothetical protein
LEKGVTSDMRNVRSDEPAPAEPTVTLMLGTTTFEGEGGSSEEEEEVDDEEEEEEEEEIEVVVSSFANEFAKLVNFVPPDKAPGSLHPLPSIEFSIFADPT